MMESYRIVAVAVVGAVMCCVVRDHAPSVAVALTVAACVTILGMSLRFLSPVLEVVRRLQEMTGLSPPTVEPMLKVAGIGILTQVCGNICEDAGEKTLQSAVQAGGSFLCLYASVPLLSAVLDLLEDMFTG